MAANGINAVRLYTSAPRWLLDLAAEHGLGLLVGLSAEREVGFLNDSADLSAIERRVRERVQACAGHPAVLAYALGNEIPAPVVRWFGPKRIGRFLARLADIVRTEDPGALVTYVNYPSTEYLDTGFCDLLCFNVYLESRERYDAYLPRLQNLAGERPLLITELGLDSQRNGLEAQASLIEDQLATTFARGAAGVFVYAWTDEWHRAGEDVHDWDFGIVRRDRTPKPALAAVRRAFQNVPFPAGGKLPRISIVICTYNGSRTLHDALDGVRLLEYPDFECIVVNDGSTDSVPTIAAMYDVRLISTENRGLSAARNTGWQAATGEIVAYLDDDARPDPHWLHYLAWAFRTTRHVGIGGPNLAPSGDGWIAECVAHSPGGPLHVLIGDTEAEHIPGCNMAFRRSALEAISGFDARFRTAGDDVDLCWRLMDAGGTIGFHAGAMVWHHRRNSVKTYWKQQFGYGRAEALLEDKYPDRYNELGHYSWAGRIYGNGLTRALSLRAGRVYHGMWGSAPFQSRQEPATSWIAHLPLMPEWHLLTLALAMVSLLGIFWHPLLWALPLLAVFVGLPVAQAVTSAWRESFSGPPATWGRRRWLTALMHLMQPVARLRGRLKHGLSPWRVRGERWPAAPLPREFALWTEQWRAPEQRLQDVDAALRERGAVVRLGGAYDRWDLEVRGGLLGSARVLTAVEEHGQGRQMVRARVWPVVSGVARSWLVVLGISTLVTATVGAPLAAGVLAFTALLLALRIGWECGRALRTLASGVSREWSQGR